MMAHNRFGGKSPSELADRAMRLATATIVSDFVATSDWKSSLSNFAALYNERRQEAVERVLARGPRRFFQGVIDSALRTW